MQMTTDINRYYNYSEQNLRRLLQKKEKEREKKELEEIRKERKGRKSLQLASGSEKGKIEREKKAKRVGIEAAEGEVREVTTSEVKSGEKVKTASVKGNSEKSVEREKDGRDHYAVPHERLYKLAFFVMFVINLLKRNKLRFPI